MVKKIALALGGFVVLVASLAVIKAAQIKEKSSAPHVMPATAVSTIKAEEVLWKPSLHAIGTLAPVQGVMVSADADGTVVRIETESGALVNKGDLLVEIDTTVERANLKAVYATTELNRINLVRSQELWERQAISKSEYDAAQAAAAQSIAAAAALEAQIAKKLVRAPFMGRVGIRQINVGQFVARGAPMLPLQSLDAIYVNFNVPQRQFPSLSVGGSVRVAVDAYPEREFAAKVTAINAEVDSTTRNISVQATMDNPGELLRAGMFVGVDVELASHGKQIAVPATAISYASYGNSVFIVETMKGPDEKEYLGARQQFVKLGATRGDLVVVIEGVKPGEDVVSSGVFKLRNHAHVQVNNSAQPASSANPTPDNT